MTSQFFPLQTSCPVNNITYMSVSQHKQISKLYIIFFNPCSILGSSSVLLYALVKRSIRSPAVSCLVLHYYYFCYYSTVTATAAVMTNNNSKIAKCSHRSRRKRRSVRLLNQILWFLAMAGSLIKKYRNTISKYPFLKNGKGNLSERNLRNWTFFV